MKKEEVNILFASNDNYAFMLATVLVSLFENKKGDYGINIFVIDDEISEKNKTKLHEIERKYNFKINYLQLKNFNTDFFKKVPTSKILPRTTYYRIFFKDLLPKDIEKILYLDCDTIVRKDIKDIFEIDLKGHTIGAVEHSDTLDKKKAIMRLGLKNDYFNAGVLLIDVNLWKKTNIEEKCINAVHILKEKIIVVDQDILNYVFNGDYYHLPFAWNNTNGIGECYIRHFVDAKPYYLFSAIPHHKEWMYYIKKTPFKNERFKKLFHISFAKKYKLYPIIWLYNFIIFLRNRMQNLSHYSNIKIK